MLQHLERDLKTLHSVIHGKRIDGHYMEELIARAINSDFSSGTKAIWKEANHDKDADIVVSCATGEKVLLSIKSGRQTKRGVVISGYRLQGLANGFPLGSLAHLLTVSDFLNGQLSQMIAVPCQIDDNDGRRFVYFVSYLDASFLSCGNEWQKHNSVFRQTNNHGVIIELRPSCSWQVWWTIPVELFETSPSLYI
jgi:hypothetical protein